MADPRQWVRGTQGPDTIATQGQNFRFSGEGGDDVMYGGPASHLVRPVGERAYPDPSLAYTARSAGILAGADGNDWVYGTGGRDYLYGGGGDDHIFGLQGGDHLDGGPGKDTYVFRPLAGQITDTAGDYISIFERGLDKIDLSAYENPAAPGAIWRGTDALTSSGPQLQVGYAPQESGGITVRFVAPYNDHTMSGEFSVWAGRAQPPTLSKTDFAMDWAGQGPVKFQFASEHQAEAARLFDTVFNRAPDKGGLEYWRGVLEQGAPLEAVAEGFMSSKEFQSNYAGTDNKGFVEKLYTNVLDRPGDADGVSYWQSALDEKRADRSDIVCSFSESPEHVQAFQPGEWVL
jgi:hypothetical protein